MYARDIMTTEVITVTSSTSLAEAIRLMLSDAVSGLPVVGPSNEVIGVVTEKDLLTGQDLLVSDEAAVEAVMTTPAIVVQEDTTIEEIVHETLGEEDD